MKQKANWVEKQLQIHLSKKPRGSSTTEPAPAPAPAPPPPPPPRQMLLSDKYRPACLAAVLGNDKAKSDLRTWFESGSYRATPVLLYGPSGIGKTSLARTFFASVDLVVQEVRSFDVFNETVHTQTSVFAPRRGIVIDEIHTLDRVQFQKIAAALKTLTRQKRGQGTRRLPPIICICDDPVDRALESLKTLARCVQMRTPYLDVNNDVKLLLHRVARSEQLSVSAADVRYVTQCARGDLRHALNELEFIAVTAKTRTSTPPTPTPTPTTTTRVTPAPAPNFLMFQSPFTIAGLLLEPRVSGYSATQLCDAVFNGAVSSSDLALVKHVVHETYPDVCPGSGLDALLRLATHADVFSVVDAMDFHVTACSAALFVRETHLFSVSCAAGTTSRPRVKLSFTKRSAASTSHKTKFKDWGRAASTTAPK